MEGIITLEGDRLLWQGGHELLSVEPWGPDGMRVRATPLAAFPPSHGALLPQPAGSDPRIETGEFGALLRNGRLACELSLAGGLCFRRADTGTELLAEEATHLVPPLPAGRGWLPGRGDCFQLQACFRACPDERLYGLGQHQHGRLDQKGCVIDLVQVNTEVNIPFLLSSRGYGFLWNNPGTGRVELGHNGTRWVAEATRALDYYLVTGDTPSDILARYADATGHPPMLPAWAAGFWQCKLRYRTQEELLEVAREYRRRGLPLSVIVIDFGYWKQMGEWEFDPQWWPDPAAMVRELKELGIELMVSFWPTLNANSPTHALMQRRGWLVRSNRGVDVQTIFVDTRPAGRIPLSFYDATHPDARRFIWEKLRASHYALGIRAFWLDADEPELQPWHADNARYHLGDGPEVGNLYPLLHQQGFFEGLAGEGEQEILTLSRSAWAGSQRYGAAVWSGDIPSTFDSLRRQVPAGLNIGLSGIPWWTTDIGGFHGGNLSDPEFRELIVRWFQYGLFCPLFRLHGFRKPFEFTDPGFGTGAGNEIWSFGEPAYGIIRRLLFVRERLRPYLMEQMRAAHEYGLAPMRPLFVDFPGDPACWEVADQFMLGPDLLAAPVLHAGQHARAVYLPARAAWVDAWTGQVLPGGCRIEAAAPLERVPAYWRQGSPHYVDFSRVQE